MDQLLWEPRCVASIGDERAEAMCVVEDTSSLLLLGQRSVGLAPVHAVMEGMSDTISFLVLEGSEICGGRYAHPVHYSERGVVVISSSPGAHGDALHAVKLAIAITNKTEKVSVSRDVPNAVGVFEPTPRSSTAAKNDTTKNSSLRYKLRHCYQAEKGFSIHRLCPVGHGPVTGTVPVTSTFAILQTSLSEASVSLRLSIVAATSLEPITNLTVPLSPEHENVKGLVWELVELASDRLTHRLLMLWTSGPSGTSHHFASFFIYNHSNRSLQFLGWLSLASYADVPDAILCGVRPVPCCSSGFTVSQGSPNLLLQWSTGVYQLLSVCSTAADTGCSIVPVRQYRALTPSPSSSATVLPLFPSIAVEMAWCSDKSTFCMRLRHLMEGVCFAVTPYGDLTVLNSSDSSPPSRKAVTSEISTYAEAQGLSAHPKHLAFFSNANGDLTLFFMVKRQVYCHCFPNLTSATSSRLLEAFSASSCHGDTTVVHHVLPPSHALSSLLRFLNIPNDATLDYVLHLGSKNQKNVSVPESCNRERIGPIMCQLIENGVLSASPQLIDALLEAGLKDVCHRILRYCTTVPEDVCVYLLKTNVEAFLYDVIMYTTVSRDELIQSLRKQLTTEHVECIFELLAAWCSVLTTLPPVLADNEGLPPLDKVADFISVFIDAKSQELFSCDNEALTTSLQQVAASLVDALVVKKNLQKLQGTSAFLRNQTIMSAVYDRFNIHAQLEHLQSKYQGTGNADMTKWQWAVNIHRDTLASNVGHYSRLAYLSTAENAPISRLRFEFLQSMIRPCGPPPSTQDDA